MTEENISQEFSLKNIDKTKDYFMEEINQNELMSKKHGKVCTTLNYIEQLLILVSRVRFTFSFLVIIPVGISSSAVVLKSCVITTTIEKCIKKKKKKNDKVIFLTKIKLNTIKVLISMVLAD